MKIIRSFLVTFLIVALGTFIVFQGLNLVLNKKEQSKSQPETEAMQSVYLVAIGDSLTKGVGDSTKNGGYVPLVANQLKETAGINEVITKNYGVTGERSDQILKRIQQDDALQADIKQATIIVLSAGGNDLIQTFKKEKLAISEDSFLQPEENYKKNLSLILKELNTQNPKAQVYVFGLYNPYEYVFPELTEMKDTLLSWNTATQKLSEENKATYFSLSNLFNGETESTISKLDNAAKEKRTNKLLYEEDLFHPNNEGYQLIANELYHVIIKQIKEEN